MKFATLYLLAGLTVATSCQTNPDKGLQELKTLRRFEHIDKNKIAYIELQVADTSLIDPLTKPLSGLTRIGEGLSFIDSSGKQTLKPTQTTTFKGEDKDTLINILNTYLDTPQDSLLRTACAILYRHVFTIYDSTGKINDRAYLCLDCTQFDFIKRNAELRSLQKQTQLFTSLIKTLRKSGVYLPDNGPASTTKE